ncbi:acyltransferase family protein [Hymenobacter norwichensis]|uniref:acyltransferase family protein n=1 Tax=Hymenobacter norwichensis TaxID=223903 RepID=UPI00040EA011|nr:acyltransferase [Hymenobacter norwichensis]
MSASTSSAHSSHTLHYLDGIRGLAAVVVVVHHLASIFYPALITADPHAIRLGSWELLVAGGPLNVLLGGHLAVCLFFVLSGVVLSEQYFRTGQLAAIRSQAARRYVRLVVPVGFSVLLATGLHWAGAFRHVELGQQLGNTWLSGFWQEPLGTGWELALDALVRVPLNGEAKYNPVHWTLNTELVGSYFVFAFLALFGDFRRRGWLYGFMLVVLHFSNLSFYLAAFTVGIALNDARHHITWLVAVRRYRRVVVGLLLLAAVLLGSFPQAGFIEIETTPYRLLEPDWLTHDRAMQLAHILGAAAFIAAVTASGTLRRILGARWLRWLGSISFSLYLLHFLVIATFTSALFLALPSQISYHAGVALSLLATVPVLLLLAWLMYRLIDLPGIRLARWLYQRLFQRLGA